MKSENTINEALRFEGTDREKSYLKSQSFVHLIDKNGNKIKMLNTDWHKLRKSSVDSNCTLRVDIAWYRSHGYTHAEEVFNCIENNHFH